MIKLIGNLLQISAKKERNFKDYQNYNNYNDNKLVILR